MKASWIAACTVALLTTTACNSANSAPAASDAAATAQDPAKAEPAKGASAAADPNAGIPAVREGYDWNMRINNDERSRSAILAYEMANTDDQPMSFTCEEGGRRIFAGVSGVPDDLSSITLASGDQTLRLNGQTERVDAMDSNEFSSVEIPGDSPFLEALRQNGWLRLTVNGQTQGMAADSTAAGAAVARFVNFCRDGEE